ncbi:MAG: hypothetical protein DI536_00150 [Archangium gephyra]|uniref:Restriction endonuclease subunit S n=1 Tax=Archangium gephyra TaxID=48 RepID=A0A2W5TYP8_9BACT|nr:MAG: hypothetical protein DI536_00150 [Archangium gephyra]
MLKGSGGTKEDITDAGVPCVRYGDIYTTHGLFIETARSHVSLDRSRDYTRLAYGDVLFAASGEKLEEIGKSAVNLMKGSACCGGDLILLRPHETNSSRFLGYACDSTTSILQKASMGRGTTVKHIYPDELRNLVLFMPPFGERAAIADFLDREVAKIDALVAEQERLIELLKEKRQAVISHAVTKGLNPNAPMKDSGIEWLGQIPAHWTLTKANAVTTFLTSGPRGWSERVGDSGALFIQSGDLNDSLGVEFGSANRVLVGSDAEAARTRLQDGDVVVCITGAKTGNVAVCVVVPEESYVNQHVCLLRPSPAMNPVFFAASLKSSSGQTYFDLAQYGLKQGLSLQNVKDAPTLVPPRAEQDAIVESIARWSRDFDALELAAGTSIGLMAERRAALISAAVTGQIDVRPESQRTAA